MADVSDDEALDLEAMRKEDGSWHPCRVSLSSSKKGFGIILDFGGCSQEDILSKRDDALRRLRYRSHPLQQGECQHVKQGECILAMYKAGARSLFFDAVVEKPYRVRHSSRLHCRCTYRVEWLNSELKGKTSTVSSNSIMRLSGKGIESHPVFSASLNSLNSTKDLGTPPVLCNLGETSCEDDLDRLLDQQIQEISRLVDGSKECSEDIFLEDKKEDISRIALNKVPQCNHSSIIKLRRSPTERQVEAEFKEHPEDKAFLTPLAARAALASAVHKLDWKPELSFCFSRKYIDSNTSTKDLKEHINTQSSDFTCIATMYDASTGDNEAVTPNPTQHRGNDDPSELTSLVQPSSPNIRNVERKLLPNEIRVMLDTQEKPEQAYKRTQEMEPSSPTIMKHSMHSQTNMKPTGDAVPRRMTRSAARKGLQNLTGDMEQGSSNEESSISRSTTRSTCSTELNAIITSEINQDAGTSNLSQHRERTLVEDLITPEKNKSTKRKLVSTPANSAKTRASTRTVVLEEAQGETLVDEHLPTVQRKSISSRKPERRFSPRLRFLPPAHSQKKSSQ